MIILVEINFGRCADIARPELEDVAESYVASLFHHGHLCREYFLTWIKGELICHTLMAGLGAHKMRFHSPWSKTCLKQVIKVFGRAPIWTIRDDETPKRNTSWHAPTLHLFTDAFDWRPPLCRGDNGKRIPTFLLPVTDQLKDDLYGWQDEYAIHDKVWLNSRTLETAAYRELAAPNSRTSTGGRSICAEIEKATGVPTYYYMMRYYASAAPGDIRPCPGCGQPWHSPQPEGAPYHHWPFRCEPCRLVSVEGVEIDKRLAKIGQWNPK